MVLHLQAPQQVVGTAQKFFEAKACFGQKSAGAEGCFWQKTVVAEQTIKHKT